jgi:hypothetical protein
LPILFVARRNAVANPYYNPLLQLHQDWPNKPALKRQAGGQGFTDDRSRRHFRIGIHELMSLRVKRFGRSRGEWRQTHAPGGIPASRLKISELLDQSWLAGP